MCQRLYPLITEIESIFFALDALDEMQLRPLLSISVL
jgi:hypothetical protein